MKTHYAFCDTANESDPETHWSSTACGLEYTESPMSSSKKEVTCKNCLKVIHKYDHGAWDRLEIPPRGEIRQL